MAQQTAVTHTPGPWTPEIIDSPRGRYWIVQDAAGDNARVFGPVEAEETIANAYLIAAAPTLLAVLKDCADWLGRNYEGPIEEARAAISLASPQESEATT